MLPKKYQNIKRDLIIKKSSTGLGLYTNEDINKNAFVIEYVGPILNEKEADKRGGKYLFEIKKDKYIDGSTRKNLARYINHSCSPNCTVNVRNGHVYILTKKKIKKGEELNYDYEKEYFDAFIKPVGCKCLKCKSKK